MQHDPIDGAGWFGAQLAGGLPAPLDSETLALLRSFLAPILQEQDSWTAIAEALATKGYGLAFRDGHLVLLNHDGNPICTGSALGVPLREISARIGRPSIRASADGCKGSLR